MGTEVVWLTMRQQRDAGYQRDIQTLHMSAQSDLITNFVLLQVKKLCDSPMPNHANWNYSFVLIIFHVHVIYLKWPCIQYMSNLRDMWWFFPTRNICKLPITKEISNICDIIMRLYISLKTLISCMLTIYRFH